jgi:hypothetical protein
MPTTNLCVMCRGILGESLEEDTRYKEEEEFMDDAHICVVCARKERVQKKIKEFTPFMEAFSQLVNNTVYDHDGVITDALVTCFFQQHRYLQQEMIIGLIKIFSKLGEQSGSVMYEDARNQWALKWCKQASKMEVL